MTLIHVKEDRSLRTPTVLLGYQSRWQEDDAKVKVCEKGRRIGLTWDEASEDALLAASRSGMDVFYIGYNKDMAQEFIGDCADWAKFYSKAAGEIEEYIFKDEDKDIITFRIKFASGHKIVALSSRPSNLRGMQGKVVIDEAAFHDDLKELLKAALALLMWGGRVVIISTHDGDENTFNDLIKEIRAGKKPYSLHRITFDDALADGLYERICLRLGKEWSQGAQDAWRDETIDLYGDGADEELFCIPSQGGGAFLPLSMLEACQDETIPIVRLTCAADFVDKPKRIREAEIKEWCQENLDDLLAAMPENYPTYFGEDFGRSGDLSVVWPVQEQPGMKYRAPFVVELRNVPFEQQKQILFYICDRLPRFRGGALDARGNGEYLAEVARQEYGPNRIIEVKLSQEWYRENMPRFKSAFEDKETFIPKDGDTLDDHRAVKMVKGIAKVPDTGRTKGRDGQQRHGDSAIAHALGNFAVKEFKGNGEVEYKTTIKRRFATKGAW
jgi:phage FluMu gp28-like protein